MRRVLNVAAISGVTLSAWVGAASAAPINALTKAPVALVIPVPEPSIPSLLLIESLGVVALVFLFCRRATGKSR